VKDLFVASDFPDLLAGLGDPDDAAVWKLDADRALVVTTDFFTPVVDDPFDFGQVAAANALSDVYAMGGQPFLALNVAALLPNLPVEVNAEILRGGAEICRQAGVVVAGGHTVQDKEPKFGLVVLGFVHPERLLRKAGARPGDLLVLTKPLGFGVTTTALKQGKADTEDVAEVVSWMVRLNRSAAALALEFDVHCATDVTGFSLLGHGLEMAEASSVCFRFTSQAIPFVSGAEKYANLWTFPGGASDNRLYYGPRVHFASGITEEKQMLLFDPQTSGGLLLALPPTQKATFFSRAREMDQPVWLIGEVRAGNGIEVD
jgi:selenide, water dikinase